MDFSELFVFCFWTLIFVLVMYQLFLSIRVVPQKTAMLVERLGKYHQTLNSGFHLLIPFIEKVSYVIDLKEEAVDVPPQDCFTKDEVRVIVDGIIYLSVTEPAKAAYGITSYKWAAVQLAQTTTRSVIGKMALDRTFEERSTISNTVVAVLEETGREWGIRVHRYEIRNIQPPDSVKSAMEKQVTAERERRAILAKSEGEKQARINKSEGFKRELINKSEGEKQKRINEAEGKASEIKSLADATAESIEKIADSLTTDGGKEALSLQLSERYLNRVGKLAHQDTDVLLPMNLGNCGEIIKDIPGQVIEETK